MLLAFYATSAELRSRPADAAPAGARPAAALAAAVPAPGAWWQHGGTRAVLQHFQQRVSQVHSGVGVIAPADSEVWQSEVKQSEVKQSEVHKAHAG